MLLSRHKNIFLIFIRLLIEKPCHALLRGFQHEKEINRIKINHKLGNNIYIEFDNTAF